MKIYRIFYNNKYDICINELNYGRSSVSVKLEDTKKNGFV